MDNPLLVIEAMFRFQTKEIKNDILQNYELQVARFGMIGKETDQDKEKLINEAYDENILFEDEQLNVEDQEEEE